MIVTIRSSSSDVISPALEGISLPFPPQSSLVFCNTPFVQVDIGFLAHQVGIASPNTLDLSQGIHDFLFAIDVGVEQTEDELEAALF